MELNKMTLYEKSLKILELPAILTQLASEASSENAKFAAVELRPSDDIHQIKTRLSETSAAKNMIALRGNPPFTAVKEIKNSIRRADMGGMLNTTELLDIASLLRVSASAISYSNSGEATPTAIDYLFSALRGNKLLESKISSAIIAPDEIADNASRELSDIRRHTRLAGERVRQSLNKIITSQAYAKALQEPIITMKNDRYVVPVKAEHKSTVPGLVHDISSSGATLFIEPMVAVQINNEIRELLAKEKLEIERILMELSADTAAVGKDIICDFDIIVGLDLIFAKAKLSYKHHAVEPIISEDSLIKLRKAKHPLLPQKTAVPTDVTLGGEFDTLVITGPNTGGKTVTLKTIGLLCAMTQCGLHIPVSDGSSVPVFENILADIGDEQSIEQSLSTFSSHMTNIVKILEASGNCSLLLFDELGAGTDPVEGAALAISIIEHARSSGAKIAATTHYAELKTFALTSKGVVNASCEFDVETLRPTYKLIMGVPGKSNAFAISQRLGLPQALIEDAKKRVDTEDAAFEDVLSNLEATRIRLEAEALETSRLLLAAEEKYRLAEEYRARTEKEREKASISARREAEKILDSARNTAESVVDELRQMRKNAADTADWQKMNEQKAQLFRRLNESEDAMYTVTQSDDDTPRRTPAAGDRVRINGLGTTADVISVSPDGILTLQAGIMKVTVKSHEVTVIEGETQSIVKKHIAKSETKLREVSARPELDLRGMLTDDAMPILERFIDSAKLAKLESVTIIHGKGTGAMRVAVHQYLKRERQVKSFRLGRYGEGETGVTIVEL